MSVGKASKREKVSSPPNAAGGAGFRERSILSLGKPP